jgi:hypothetical protein
VEKEDGDITGGESDGNVGGDDDGDDLDGDATGDDDDDIADCDALAEEEPADEGAGLVNDEFAGGAVLEDNDDFAGGANEDSDSDGDEMIGAGATGAPAVDSPTGAAGAATGGTAEGCTDNRDEGATNTGIPADLAAQLILALEASP